MDVLANTTIENSVSIDPFKPNSDHANPLLAGLLLWRIAMNGPDPAPTEPGNQPIPVEEPDDGTTEADEDEGDAA